ncbi:MAG: hypothetical protein ABL921_14250 [Pirellula sp.]
MPSDLKLSPFVELDKGELLEVNSAAILGDSSLNSSDGVFVETGIELGDGVGDVVGDVVPGNGASVGKGGNDGKAVELLRLGDVFVLDNVLGTALPFGGRFSPVSFVPEPGGPGRPNGGRLSSDVVLDGLENDCAKGDGGAELLKFGAGVLLKFSNPVDVLPPELVDTKGPAGPETSGTPSISTKFCNSGFNGVSVPLSATYPP